MESVNEKQQNYYIDIIEDENYDSDIDSDSFVVKEFYDSDHDDQKIEINNTPTNTCNGQKLEIDNNHHTSNQIDDKNSILNNDDMNAKAKEIMGLENIEKEKQNKTENENKKIIPNKEHEEYKSTSQKESNNLNFNTMQKLKDLKEPDERHNRENQRQNQRENQGENINNININNHINDLNIQTNENVSEFVNTIEASITNRKKNTITNTNVNMNANDNDCLSQCGKCTLCRQNTCNIFQCIIL